MPVFLFKRDAIPGPPHHIRVHSRGAGTYRGQCAEFCGVNHDRMPFTVRAVPRADFEAWLAQSGGPAPGGVAVSTTEGCDGGAAIEREPHGDGRRTSSGG